MIQSEICRLDCCNPLIMSRSETSSDEKLFHVDAESENQTVATVMRRWLTDRSWSQIRKLIASRSVMINGNLCVDAGRRLKATEVIKLLAHPVAAAPRDDDVRVEYLDADVIVVEKPAGITSNRHREERAWSKRRKQIQPTLDEMLPHIIARIEGRRNHRGVPVPVRAVHRLDRDTSGLMVFARTREAERILSQQFRQHTTHRRYLAIVEGQVPAQTIRSRLVRDRGDGRRGSSDAPDVGKEAITHIKPIASIPLSPREGRGEGAGFSLVQCQLETGRTHQIRIHLSEHGHPVCGEKVYRQSKSGAPKPDASGAPRLALHAAELGFIHPVSGKPLRFRSQLPEPLADFWRRLSRQKSAADERK
jgi:23S rRNA pseudouridine1911/1915/1917 synthase